MVVLVVEGNFLTLGCFSLYLLVLFVSHRVSFSFFLFPFFSPPCYLMVNNTYTSSLKLSLSLSLSHLFLLFFSILLGFGFFSLFVSLPFLFHIFYLLSQYILGSQTLDSHFSFFFSIKLDIFSLEKLLLFLALPPYL
jgi:hypothetical protein